MVISIVALLMAVLLARLSRVRKQARAVGCPANLRQSGIYFAAYAAENNGLLTMGAWKKSDNPLHWDDERWMGVVLGPSLDRTRLLLCPAASKPRSMPDLTKIPKEGPPYGTGTAGDRHSAWTLAFRRANGSIDTYVGSLGFNAHAEHIGLALKALYHYPTVDIRQASRMPVSLDCALACIYPSGPNVGPPPYEDCLSGDGAFAYSLINRHEGGVNFLFLDWSVRKVGLKEFWTLKWYRDYDTHGKWTRAGGVQAEDWPAWMRGFKDY